MGNVVEEVIPKQRAVVQQHAHVILGKAIVLKTNDARDPWNVSRKVAALNLREQRNLVVPVIFNVFL